MPLATAPRPKKSGGVFACAADLFAERAARPNPDMEWRARAHAHQLPPSGSWRVWLLLAGRGAGKTEASCRWAARQARRFPGCRIALVAATFADARDTLVEGVSGLLTMFEPYELRGGSVDRAWNRSLGELFLANGSRFKVYSSEKPRQLRGPQHHFAVADEVAWWSDAHKGTSSDTTWANLNIGTRLPARPGWPEDYHSQIAVATTPRPVSVLHQRDPDKLKTAAGLMQKDTTVISRGKTIDNLANLTTEYQREVVDPLLGTTLGRQELDGELVFDVEGALWKLAQLDDDRVDTHPDLYRVMVGVDPSVTSKATSDECGIVVAGLDKAWRLGGHGYVLADYSGRMTPNQWGLKVCRAAIEHNADAICAEKNHGHDLVIKLVEDSWAELVRLGEATGPMPRVIPVHSKVGKRLRAEPIAGQFEQHRWHTVSGRVPRLEDQLTTWIPGEGDSPDRVDAIVHAATELTSGGGGVVIAETAPATPIGGTTPPVQQQKMTWPVAAGPNVTPVMGTPGAMPVVPALSDLQSRAGPRRPGGGRRSWSG